MRFLDFIAAVLERYWKDGKDGILAWLNSPPIFFWLGKLRVGGSVSPFLFTLVHYISQSWEKFSYHNHCL